MKTTDMSTEYYEINIDVINSPEINPRLISGPEGI